MEEKREGFERIGGLFEIEGVCLYKKGMLKIRRLEELDVLDVLDLFIHSFTHSLDSLIGFTHWIHSFTHWIHSLIHSINSFNGIASAVRLDSPTPSLQAFPISTRSEFRRFVSRENSSSAQRHLHAIALFRIPAGHNRHCQTQTLRIPSNC